MHIVDINSKRKDIDVVNYNALKLVKSIISGINTGDITSIGIAWVDKDGSIGGDISSGDNGLLMWASLENLAKQFHNELLEDV